MPTPVLPLDLLLEICSHCILDDLTRCALVNSDFLEASRVHLYTSVHLTYPATPRNRARHRARFPTAAPFLLSRTRHLEIGGLVANEPDTQLLHDFFHILIYHQQLTSLVPHLYFYHPKRDIPRCSLLELLQMPSLLRVRVYISLGDNLLVPILSCPAVRDLEIRLGGSHSTSPTQAELRRTTTSKLRLDTLRLYTTIFESSAIRPRQDWEFLSPFLDLTQLKRLQIDISIDKLHILLHYHAILQELPTQIECIALIFSSVWELPRDISTQFAAFPLPLSHFVALKCLDVIDVSHNFQIALDLLLWTVEQLSNEAQIQSINVSIKVLEGLWTVVHPCWEYIRSRHPSARVTLHLRDDSATPRPSSDLAINGVDQIIWMDGTFGMDAFTQDYSPFLDAAKITD